MRSKIKVIKEVTDIFPEYKPKVGKVYNADFYPANHKKIGNRNNESCVIEIKDKRILLKKGEFEVVE